MQASHVYIKDYPRPQFVRKDWLNLNGEWDFQFDDKDAGEREGWYNRLPSPVRIQVPFTYESKASGIEDQKVHPNVWYQRTIDSTEFSHDRRTILHFEGADYVTKVWVNHQFVGRHQGGYCAFSFDITDYLTQGANRLTVKVEDSKSCTQPRGKQRWKDENFGCWYTQTTGIWKTVWLERVGWHHMKSVKITPDFDQSSVHMEYRLHAEPGLQDLQLVTSICLEGKLVKRVVIDVDRACLSLSIPLTNDQEVWKVKAWTPQNPHLYDVEFVLQDKQGPVDQVFSYFGLRKISIENGTVCLNNTPLYQKLILDQGYWPDTNLTPPSEEALIRDIEAVMEMGFNGVRKHQKTEDARFLYWCDRRGLLVWSEMAAAYEFNQEAVRQFTQEWMEIIEQFHNHPCIITWVPFNESWGVRNIYADKQQQQFTEAIYHLTKTYDPMRPVVVNDGWEHTVSDILTLHDYEESGEAFADRYADKDAITSNKIAHNKHKYALAGGYAYRGQPIIISEYGGIAFKDEKGWGYGNQVASEEDFLTRYGSITAAIMDISYITGFCYTQITDVQQEVNGLLTADRAPKVNLKKIRELNRS